MLLGEVGEEAAGEHRQWGAGGEVKDAVVPSAPEVVTLREGKEVLDYIPKDKINTMVLRYQVHISHSIKYVFFLSFNLMCMRKNNLTELKLILITNVNSTIHGEVQELVKIISHFLNN